MCGYDVYTFSDYRKVYTSKCKHLIVANSHTMMTMISPTVSNGKRYQTKVNYSLTNMYIIGVPSSLFASST